MKYVVFHALAGSAFMLCANSLTAVASTIDTDNIPASATSKVAEVAPLYTGDFFKIADAPHWDAATVVNVNGNALTFNSLASGSIIGTPKAVNTDFEDSSSHLLSKSNFADKVVRFDFMLSENGASDVLLMARYPVRLSVGNKDLALSAPGAVGRSWDEWNKDNPKRAWGGMEPLQSLDLAANTWHSFEANFRAPRHDEAHNKIENALIMSVSINGKTVQQNVIAESPSKNATFHWEDSNGPLTFDAIEGQIALRNVLVSRADFSNINMPSESGASTNEAELVNLVEQGQKAFKNYGCAECHSLKLNDNSVKTGPNLYGLFTPDVRKRSVQNQEKHVYDVRADSSYFKRSIRNAEAELAIAESGANKGNAYLPIMPRYTEQIVPDKDISAIYSYLLTQNDLWHQGPTVRLEPAAGPIEYQPMQDALQFIVQDRVRIQRGPLPDISARAISVGNPNALHYSFDPRNLSVAKIWQGGFIESSGELVGRGGNGLDIGYQAIELNLGDFGGLLRPINAAGNMVDFSFKTPKFKDYERIKQSAYSTRSFEERLLEQDAKFIGYFKDSTKKLASPTFFYSVSGNKIGITHELSVNGDVSINISGKFSSPQSFAINPLVFKNLKVSTGKLIEGIWQLPASDKVDANLNATIATVDTPWQPDQLDFAFETQALEVKDAEAQLPAGYSIESWLAPKDNLGREFLFEAIGLDTNSDGSILVSTRTGGVWRIKNNRWHLVAEGIFDSLGVLSESADGSVSVVGSKAELTRLRDINGDGIADYYDTLFDHFTNAGNYHSYTHGPTKDQDGNYVLSLNLAHGDAVFYTAGGNVMGSHGGYVGWAVRVKPNGEFEYFANGLRSPAGLGADLNGQIWYADNQGDFVGSSKIFMLQDGKFYGHPAGLIDEAGMTPDSPEVTWNEVIKRKEKAVIVVPHGKVANSLGNPVWDSTDGNFGPYSRQMFIGDQTQSNLTRVVIEEVNGQWQGAMIPFASGMESGVMRPKFLPDNSLLLGQTGRGWHAKGGNVAALQRIVYDGSTQHLHVQNVNITNNGFVLTFTQALPSNMSQSELEKAVSVNSWTYRDAQAYGSDELGKKDDAIKSISVNKERSALTIVLNDTRIPKVHPEQTARVYHIALKNDKLSALSGRESLDVYYSAHTFKDVQP